MEEFVLEKRLRAVTIRTQRLDKLRQPQVQSLEVLRTPLSPFPMHIVAGGTADITNSCVARIVVKNRHFARCVREYRAPYVL